MVVPPLLIAHRAGNDAAQLLAAERAGADVIEADLHLRRGQLELRHLKTVGPLPLYWDRWALAPPWRRFERLEDLLAGADPETVLMLDLKGSDPAVARLVASALDRHRRGSRVLVSAREWRLLDEIDAGLAERVASAARPGQLHSLVAHARRQQLAGASLHLRLLASDHLPKLQAHVPLVMAWPVNRPEEAARALRLGVEGLISDDLALIARLRRERLSGGPAGGAQGVAQGQRAERDQQREHADGEVDERHSELHADAERDDAGSRGGLA